MTKGISIVVCLALSVIIIDLRVRADTLWGDVCTQDNVKKLPFCDVALDVNTRTTDFVMRLNISQKVFFYYFHLLTGDFMIFILQACHFTLTFFYYKKPPY